MARLQQGLSSPTATAGYAFAIASLLGTVRHSELGLPTAKALVSLFTYAAPGYISPFIRVLYVYITYCMPGVFPRRCTVWPRVWFLEHVKRRNVV